MKNARLHIVDVTVYQGKNFVLTNEYVLKKAVEQPILQPVLVLVPDRFTLQAEKFLLKHKSHLLNTRVVTYSMLYRLVASELNHGVEPAILDKTSAVMYLWKAIRQVSNQLQWFKSSVGHYDFAEKMFKTIGQMRSSCVDFSALEGKAQSTVSRKKYHDINLIYQAYQQSIGQNIDASGMLEYLITHLEESTTIRNSVVYVCGFASLSPARLQVLTAINQVAKKVVIASSEKEMIAQLANYKPCQIQTPTFSPVVETAGCETERGEAMVVIERIVTFLNQGVAPEEIVVLLNDFDTLAPVWQVVADQYHVPVNIDVSTKLSTLSEAKYLRDLLELAINDNAENTVAVLFNQCSEVPDEKVFELENQIIKTDLRARAVAEVKKLSAITDIVALCDELKTLTQNEKLHDILNQISCGYGNQPLNLRDVIALFWTLCSATKVSAIPQYVNRVLIAPVDEWIPGYVKYLFISNCTEDNFPRVQDDNDILQEADLVGTQITPTPTLQRERNYRRAELLKTVASEKVIMSGANENFMPVVYLPRYNFELQDDQTPLTVGRELFFANQRVKPTMIERFYTCPRLNFMQNGLKMNPRPLHQLEANTIGTAIHEALKVYYQKLQLKQAERLELALKVGKEQLNFDYPPLTNNILKEIRFILLRLDQIFQDSKFKVKIDVEHEIKKELQHGLFLVGRVDRIDYADLGDGNQAVLVLDYKTGQVSGSVAKEIQLGNKMQLAIYSSVLSQKNVIAGAGYLPLKSGYGKDTEKSFVFHGFVDAERKDLFPSLLINEKSQYYVESEIIQLMCRHADNLVNEAVERIIAGDVKAQAVTKNTCENCPWQMFCSQVKVDCRSDALDKKFDFKKFKEVADE